MEETSAPDHKIDRLLDAVDLLKADRRTEAIAMLRELIAEDGNFEAAWLWMSVAVESLDQSSVCLDNVLRVNPANQEAAYALQRIRRPEHDLERVRRRLRFWQGLAYTSMWVLFWWVLIALTVTLFSP